MRAPAWRLRKYDAKINAESIKQRFLDHKDSMVEQEEAVFGELVLIESKAKAVCEMYGVPTIQLPFYLDFARQCYKYFKKFSQVTRTNEVTYWFTHWQSRGLSPQILGRIADLCGIAIEYYEEFPAVP